MQQHKYRLWILICLVIWAITSVSFSIFTFAQLNYDLVRLIKAVFLGFGLTCFLLGVVGVIGLNFMNKLKEVSLTGWKLFIGFYILFSALILPRVGNAMVIADEGWLAFYKHPLVLVVMAFLIGNFILNLLKSRKNQLS